MGQYHGLRIPWSTYVFGYCVMDLSIWLLCYESKILIILLKYHGPIPWIINTTCPKTIAYFTIKIFYMYFILLIFLIKYKSQKVIITFEIYVNPPSSQIIKRLFLIKLKIIILYIYIFVCVRNLYNINHIIKNQDKCILIEDSSKTRYQSD